MPQLDPAPWFWTLLTLWVILLAMLTPKILMLSLITPPTPTAPSYKTYQWFWPWP